MAGTTPLKRLGRERGQAIVVFTILLGVIGGFAALAVDLGAYTADRRDLQNAADAIALAAAQELPDESAAEDVALEWAANNDIEADWVDLTFTQQSPPSEPNPKVHVEITRDHEFAFARLIGIESTDVSAAAASIRTSPAGGDGVIPLSVTEEALNGIPWAAEVTLKYDSNDILEGNTGPIRIDGSGTGNCQTSHSYCDGVKFGAENTVCAAGYDDTYCSGPSVVDTQPGNVVGGTREAINYRMDNTDSQCDTFEEVFEDDPTTSEPGAYRFDPLCNPFISGSYASQRVVIIPVIEELCNGACEVTIVDFALFFIERLGSGECPGGGTGVAGNGGGGVSGHRPDHNPPGRATNTPTFTPLPATPTFTPGPTPTPTPEPCPGGGGGACTGNDCLVIGRFVQVGQNVGLLAGTFNPDASNTFIRLVE